MKREADEQRHWRNAAKNRCERMLIMMTPTANIKRKTAVLTYRSSHAIDV